MTKRTIFLFVLLYTLILLLGYDRYRLKQSVLVAERKGYERSMQELRKEVRKTVNYMNRQKGRSP